MLSAARKHYWNQIFRKARQVMDAAEEMQYSNHEKPGQQQHIEWMVTQSEELMQLLREAKSWGSATVVLKQLSPGNTEDIITIDIE